MNGEKVSFVLPTRNVDGNISSLLGSIFSQNYSGEIEVLIMDSSDDKTPEIARQFPVRFVRVEPDDYNYGKTRNEGVAMTDGDFLVFLSTDVEIRDKNWLSKLTQNFDDPKVAGVYGRQIPKENSTPMEQFFILNTYPAESSVYAPKNGKLEKGLVFFSNTNSAIRRSVWERIKIPEMLKSEDQEWAKRVLLSGYRIVYDAEAAVYHSHKYSMKGVFHEYFDSGAAMPALQQDKSLDYSMGRFVFDGVRFVLGEYKFMARNGHWHWIPYAIIYDLMKFLGIFLGSKQRYMPVWMKRILCKKKNHWDRYDDVIQELA
jgi:rhamnosyltransferase